MKHEDKPKEQLISEMEEMAQRIVELEVMAVDHKRLRGEAEFAYEELNQIFNIAAGGMRVIDIDFNMIRFNKTFLKLAGISEEEASVKKCYEVFRGSTCHTSDCSLARAFRGEKRVEYELEKECKDGRMVPCIITAAPFRGPDGEMIGIVEDFKDITERKLVEKHIHLLTQQLMKAQESARQRFARDLHDQVAQDLSTLKISCDTLFDDQQTVPGNIRQKLSEMADTLQAIIAAVRDLAYDLGPPGLDEVGLVRTVFQYCQEFSDKTGVGVDFYSGGVDDLSLDFDTEINLYRLVQEALNNVRRHANANLVTIRLVASFPNIILRIDDDGQGFDVHERMNSALSEKRLGLRAMEERVSLLKGKIEIQSRPKEGTKILIEVPFMEKMSG